jgi:hypothetical protein
LALLVQLKTGGLRGSKLLSEDGNDLTGSNAAAGAIIDPLKAGGIVNQCPSALPPRPTPERYGQRQEGGETDIRKQQASMMSIIRSVHKSASASPDRQIVDGLTLVKRVRTHPL